MTNLRSNFAGSFYPANPQQLADQILLYLNNPLSIIDKPRALLVPHAGIVYSGPTAGFAYKQIINSVIERVIILAPSHQIHHTALAMPQAEGAETPLGLIRFDAGIIAKLAQSAPFVIDNSPHTQEHSIEVQYPFLQLALKSAFQIVPISVGELNKRSLEEAAKRIIEYFNEKTLLIISTDFSHFHNQQTAEILDRTAIGYILSKDIEGLIGVYQRKAAECCGIYPIILGLLILKELKQNINATLLHYDTSATSSFDNQRVVGYASIAFS